MVPALLQVSPAIIGSSRKKVLISRGLSSPDVPVGINQLEEEHLLPDCAARSSELWRLV